MSILNKITDTLGLTDSEKPLRAAERQAQEALRNAERSRQASNELAQQTNKQQQLMAERLRAQEQVAAQQTAKPEEPEVNINPDGSENAPRRRTKFQAVTDPMLSIRI